jgi:hypothetical protein
MDATRQKVGQVVRELCDGGAQAEGFVADLATLEHTAGLALIMLTFDLGEEFRGSRATPSIREPFSTPRWCGSRR